MNWRLGAVGFVSVPLSHEINFNTINKIDGAASNSFMTGLGQNSYQQVILGNDIRYYTDASIALDGRGALAHMTWCEQIESPNRLRRRTAAEEEVEE